MILYRTAEVVINKFMQLLMSSMSDNKFSCFLSFLCRKNNFLEDLQRANSLMGRIHFCNGQHSRAMRCLEQAKECARKMKDKFGESECFCSIAEVSVLTHLCCIFVLLISL